MPIPYTRTATNTTAGTTQAAGYTFTEVVPANTTFVSLTAVDPATAAVGGCTPGAAAGTRCTITITSPFEISAQVVFTVQTVNPLPAGTTNVVNRAYYDTPPATCSLADTPACDPTPPLGCITTGGVTVCTEPTVCAPGEAACTAAPTTLPKVILSKSTAVTTLAPDIDVPYTLTVTNATVGTTQGAGYTFNEVVPANTTLVSVTGASSNCTGGETAGTLCTITIVSPIVYGTPAQVTFTVHTLTSLPAGTTRIVNQLYYVTPPPGCSLVGSPVCNPIQPESCVGGVCATPDACTPGDPACVGSPTSLADVYLSKTVSGQVQPGQPVVYTLTATNRTTGTTQAAGYHFTEVVPAGTRFASVSGATSNCVGGEAAGTRCVITINTAFTVSATVTFTVTALAPLPAGLSNVVNQAYYDTPPSSCSLVGTPVCDPAPPEGCTGSTCSTPTVCTAGNPACVTSAIAVADMQATGDTAVNSTTGSPVTVTTGCTNAGPDVAVNATCTVSGAPAGATTVCTPTPPVATLAVGSSISCQTTWTAGSTPVTLVTTAGSDTPDPDASNNTLLTLVSPEVTDMHVDVPPAVSVKEGDPVTVEVKCINGGPNAAVNASCEILGAPPGAVTSCTPAVPVASLAVDASITCTTTFTPPDTSPITLVTVTQSDTPDSNLSNNSGTTLITVTAAQINGGPATPVPASTREMLILLALLLAASGWIVRRKMMR
jgi:uncharacterized repeat protein (TIGR01451 family)